LHPNGGGQLPVEGGVGDGHSEYRDSSQHCMGAACDHDGAAHAVATDYIPCPSCCHDSNAAGTVTRSAMSVPSTDLRTPDALKGFSTHGGKSEVLWQEQDRRVRGRDCAQVLPPAFALEPESSGRSSSQSRSQSPLGHSESGSCGVGNNLRPAVLKLTFIKEDNTRESFRFRRRPVGLDFYKMNPITVKQVAPDGDAEILGVRSGWTVCAVNSVDVTKITPMETLALVAGLASKLEEDI